MIDIVYILGKNLSGVRDQEIKFSLRSVEKHLKNFRNVYLIGHKPVFLNDKIMHHPFEDSAQHCKERRIMLKYLYACTIPEISPKFLMFNDDFFLTKDIDATKIPYYYSTRLKNKIKHNSNGRYKKSIINTYNALTGKGYPTKYFDVHYPMYYDKDKFPEVMAKYNWEVAAGYVVKSLYANTLRLPGKIKRDVKINERLGKAEILKIILSESLFSTAEITRTMLKMLNKLYPDQSKYEI
jgi:hypothetical protein